MARMGKLSGPREDLEGILKRHCLRGGPASVRCPQHTGQTLGSPRGHTGDHPESSSSLSVYCVVWAVAPSVRAEFSIVCVEKGGMIVTWSYVHFKDILAGAWRMEGTRIQSRRLINMPVRWKEEVAQSRLGTAEMVRSRWIWEIR